MKDNDRIKSVIHRLTQEGKIPMYFLSVPDYCALILREYFKDVVNEVYDDVESADYLDVFGGSVLEPAAEEN